MTRIKILYNTPYRPHKKASKKLIHPKLKKYLDKITYIEPSTGLYGEIKAIAKFFKIKVIFKKKFKVFGKVNFVKRIIHLLGHKNLVRVKSTFCHELAHLLQKAVNVPYFKSYNLSSLIRLEQEAESLGIELFKKLFPNDILNRKHFNSYFNAKDIMWVERFYKNESVVNNLYKRSNTIG